MNDVEAAPPVSTCLLKRPKRDAGGNTVMLAINYLAVLAAAFGAFIVGGLWYSPLLFGRAYLALRGIGPDAPTKCQLRSW